MTNKLLTKVTLDNYSGQCVVGQCVVGQYVVVQYVGGERDRPVPRARADLGVGRGGPRAYLGVGRGGDDKLLQLSNKNN